MTVIESAKSSLENAMKQERLGYKYGASEVAYWGAFLDGAFAQKKEYERMTEKKDDE